ncbi:MAG: hypothetical protein U9P90_02540 [Patescibacteria group bacterium]|nr:hypothetical protein [Patescibacteria group bacterium]
MCYSGYYERQKRLERKEMTSMVLIWWLNVLFKRDRHAVVTFGSGFNSDCWVNVALMSGGALQHHNTPEFSTHGGK